MTALVKSIFPAFLLSWLVATFVGTQGSSGGLLQITELTVHDVRFHASMPLFLIGAGISWGILKMME